MCSYRTRTITACLFLSACLLAADALRPEPPKAPPPLAPAKAALRAGRFADAVQALDKLLDGGFKEGADEGVYLKALALYYDGKGAQAVTVADEVIAKHPDSAWLRKARFLKAQALVQQRKFKQAEAIYEAEANRLLSEARKQEIAGVIIKFANALATKPDPDDLGAPPPNYSKAYNLYRKALEMEIGRTLRDEVMFKRARTIQLAGNHSQAVRDYCAYLAEFDPDWTGTVGSLTRLSGQKREKPKPAGKHRLEARYRLAEAQLAANDHYPARVNAEDLIALIGKQTDKEKASDEIRRLVVDTQWLHVRTFRLPNPASQELERAVKAARDFCKAHTASPHAVVAAWWIAQAYQAHGRADQAIAAYEAFLAGRPYKLPDGDAATAKLPAFKKSPAELADQWTKLARFQIGHIRFGQKKYDQAIEAWQSYVNKYPNGPQWAACQRGTINAEFHKAIDAVSAEEYPLARELFDGFLKAHPLDARAARILFTVGQIDYARAQKLEKDKAAQAKVHEAYRAAIDRWSRLVSKYPQTDESSLALYRIGMIYEEKFGDLAEALDSYRRLTWGSHASPARARVAVMTKKHLQLHTERTFRTDEKVTIKLNVRNMEKLKFKQYFLDLEAYFRKTHATGQVEQLDVDLIQPDKIWEVKIDNYAKYKPIEQEVEIPFDKNAAGVCLINVSENDLEATTLVIRSDLEMIVKSSRREALVFVQNMRTGEPAKGVDLLFSDGKEVFTTGKTEADGVFRGSFEELKSAGLLRVFASNGRSVASNLLDLSGMQFSRGLSAKGYIYTDRPAYQPGQMVSLRGIVRDVKDGSYIAPTGQEYLVSVTDSGGRLLWQKPRKLSEFGTFHTQLTLDKRAPLGKYTIALRHKDHPGRTYSATFHVQRFKLEKMRLKLETDRQVYFRGEQVQLTVRAEYYWGQPVVDKPVRYHLPDGRRFVQKTDKDGKLVVKYDTSGLRPPAPMRFRATIEGENVGATYSAFLALQGFRVGVKPSRGLALAGEPFDVEITTTTPAGEPVGRAVTLFVLRRQTPQPDPVLNGVPWISAQTRAASEVTVEEKPLQTDEKTGKATVNLTLDKGGRYVLRATGEDRFEQVVTAESSVRISDEDDATKLRLFAATDTLQVGRKAKVRLHSRVQAKLALLTYEGETIIRHEVVPIRKGNNPINIDIGHEYFPNFRVAVAVIDGRTLRTAAKPFRVQRQLNVTVKPLKGVYGPGAKGKVELTVTDQLGKPVRAELSLALVDEALFAIFPDSTPEIRDFFQRDAERHADFRAASTCSFAYTAVTRRVVKAYLSEQERLARQIDEKKRLKLLARKLDLGEGRRRQLEAMPEPATRPSSALAGERRAKRGGDMRDGEQFGKFAGYAAAKVEPGKPKAPGESAPQARREMPSAGRWLGSIITDKEGKVVIDLPMPDNTTQWRLTARGCTVRTLVGQAKADVITRKDFFVAIKAPQMLQQGDTARILARVHNLTDYQGDVELTLGVFGGEKLDRRLVVKMLKVKIDKQGAAEALFDEVDIPLAAELRIEVTAKAGKLADALTTVLPVRPWGLEFGDHAGGAASDSRTVHIELPGEREYASRWMSISVGPDLKRSVIDMALRTQPRPRPLAAPGARCVMPPRMHVGSFAGSDLLASASALAYAKAVKAPPTDYQRLADRARSLVSGLVVSQRNDGGWSWRGTQSRRNTTDWAVTAMTFWALCEARKQGIAVHADTLGKAEQYLKNRFAQIPVTDNDAKAVLLHALSVAGAADFAHLNRLHRERNRLSAPALAYTALAFTNLKRNEFATEILAVLATKAKPITRGQRKLLNWPGSDKHAWVRDEVETTAIAVLAMMRAKSTSPRIKQAVDFLMDRHGRYGFVPAKAHGPGVRALAAYFAKGQFAEADYELTVLVNGKELRTIKGKGASASVVLPVPHKLITDGRNRVEFRMNGRGRYAYGVTLRGFSSDLKDPGSWSHPYVRGRYYRHANLEYRGKPIGASSYSLVKNIEIGQRVRVEIDMNNHYSAQSYLVVEENIPAGMMLVEGTLRGSFVHHEVDAGKIVMYYQPGRNVDDATYELIGYASGRNRVLPTVIRDVVHPDRMRIGKPATLIVLKPGEQSDDPYKINDRERYALGRLQFDDGLYTEALANLWPLFDRKYPYSERDVARMLLWIHTAEGFYDAQRIVRIFEVLRERYPGLEIPFDKILAVGRAYRDIGEYERAYLVFRATIDVSFISDANVSAVLEDEGQFLGSIDYQEDLWREYPDTAEVASAYFAISQALYQKAPHAHELAKHARQVAAARGRKAPTRKPDRIEMLTEAIRLLREFLTLYPKNPLADDAAFSMANAYLELKQYATVVQASEAFKTRFAKSDYTSGFQYMIALGHFWQREYDKALAAGKIVADGTSKDRDFARYILGQIHHAEGDPVDAIRWYRTVADQYPDAKQAIDYFEAKRIALDEVNIVRPGKPVDLKLKYRNIKSASCQVYRVDLMKLYLREKNLANITKVKLAGIKPQLEQTIRLGDGKDYVDKEKTTRLNLKDEGAYLVICRGDDLFTSAMVLITPLKIEVQQDKTSGRVRANVIDAVANHYVPEVHVKAIGSADKVFRSGETDLRGIFIADNIRGKVTVIARGGDARYAFYRGDTWLGAPDTRSVRRRPTMPQSSAPDYMRNLRGQNSMMQMMNVKQFDSLRRGVQKGVQVQQAK